MLKVADRVLHFRDLRPELQNLVVNALPQFIPQSVDIVQGGNILGEFSADFFLESAKCFINSFRRAVMAMVMSAGVGGRVTIMSWSLALVLISKELCNCRKVANVTKRNPALQLIH
jgi:hypothetical protein